MLNKGLARGQINVIGGNVPYFRSKMIHPLFMIKHKIESNEKYEIRSFKNKNTPWIICYEGVEDVLLTEDFMKNYRHLYS